MSLCPLCSQPAICEGDGAAWCVRHGTIYWPPLSDQQVARLRREATEDRERRRKGGRARRRKG